MEHDETGTEELFDCPTDWVAEHIREYVATDGERGHRYREWDTLLLTTRGRRSGKLRRTPLIYGVDGDRFVLVASNAGADRHPAWYLNVLADPQVRVQVAAKRFKSRARPVNAEERPRLWRLMTEVYPPYVEYQGTTSRQIPVVVVESIVTPHGSAGGKEARPHAGRQRPGIGSGTS